MSEKRVKTNFLQKLWFGVSFVLGIKNTKFPPHHFFEAFTHSWTTHLPARLPLVSCPSTAST